MFNIKYKGNYKDDKDLIKRKSIPKNAVEYGIVSDLKKELGRGFLIILPLVIIMLVLIIIKVKSIDFHLKMDIHFIISIFIVIVSVYLLTIVHEIIHALFYPIKSNK